MSEEYKCVHASYYVQHNISLLLSVNSLFGRFHYQEFLTVQRKAEERQCPARHRNHGLRPKYVANSLASQSKA